MIFLNEENKEDTGIIRFVGQVQIFHNFYLDIRKVVNFLWSWNGGKKVIILLNKKPNGKHNGTYNGISYF